MSEPTYREALAESIHCLRYCAERLGNYVPMTDESAALQWKWKRCAEILSEELAESFPEPQSLRA